VDTAALKQTWAAAESLGDEVPLFFYSHLFLSHPELRGMFPVSMATQRDRLVGALGRIVSSVDELGEVVGFIEQLEDSFCTHRRFLKRVVHIRQLEEGLVNLGEIHNEHKQISCADRATEGHHAAEQHNQNDAYTIGCFNDSHWHERTHARAQHIIT